jgi:hypothetical protein
MYGGRTFLSLLNFDSIRSIKERGRWEILRPQFNNIRKLIGICLVLAASFCGEARLSRTAICRSICVLHFLPCLAEGKLQLETSFKK